MDNQIMQIEGHARQFLAGSLVVDGRSIRVLVDACDLRAAVAEPSAPAFFSSIALPPATTRRAFARRCRSIPEACRSGRVWCCPASVWWTACRRGSAPRPPPPARPDDAATLLAGAGVRLRGGRR